MKCYHCKHYNLETGICDMDLCEILDPWDSVDCDYLYEEKMTTLFGRITVSPEVLAEYLVYETPGYDEDGNKTVFYRSKVDMFWVYTIREEAIAATVARLKEVYNG